MVNGSEYDLGEYNSMGDEVKVAFRVVVGGFISIEVGVGVGISAGSAHLDCDGVLSAYGGASDEVVNVDEEVGVKIDSEAGRVGVVVGVGVGNSAGSAHFDSDIVLGV